MKRSICCAIFLSLILFSVSFAEAFEIGVRGYYWFPGLSGDIKVDGSIPGTTLNLENSLGMDDESYPAIELFAGICDHHLSVSYAHANYSGTKILGSNINFAGKTFANTTINSSLEYNMFDVEYQYDLLDLENILAGFSLGVIGKVKVIDGETEIKATGATPAKESFTAPIPMVGLGLHVGILADILEARLRATGIAYSGNGIYDILADISWTPFPFIDIHGGYRAFFIDVDADKVEFNYNTSGPYAAITVSF